MKVFFSNIEKVSKKIVEILVVLLFVCVTLTGAFRSVYLEDGYGIKLYIANDSLLINLLFGIIMVVVLKFLADFVAKNMDKRRKVLLVLTLIYTFCLSLGWAAVSKNFPAADQASVYYGAKHFAADFFGDIAEKSSYFSCYPHQMGLAFFYEIILRVFNTESFHLLQGVNAVCNCITILSLYKITTLLFEDKKISVYFLLLMIMCFPLFWYTPFIYGELPSFAFSFLGIWMLLEGIYRRKKILFLIASIVALTCATAVRKNTLILIIAVVLTMLIYILKERKYAYILYLVLLMIFCTQINNIAILRYEKSAGVKINDGVPAISHIVMGLQESDTAPAPGWYNGFNFNTYAYDADYNQEEAIRISENALAARLAEFKENPRNAFKFFSEKFMAEWLNSGYACIYYTSGKYYDRLPIVESLFSGNGFHIAQFFMDKYQFVVFALAIFFAGKRDSDKYGILKYIFLVTIIGGAIFYLVWEGNGRYILPYFIMTIPYAAAGMARIERLIVVLPSLKSKESIV